MLNFDTMINLDDLKKINAVFWCLNLAIFHTNSPLFRPWLKFLVKDLYWLKGYLMLSKHFRWMLSIDIMINLDETFLNKAVFLVFELYSHF